MKNEDLKISKMSKIVSIGSCRANANTTAMRCNGIAWC